MRVYRDGEKRLVYNHLAIIIYNMIKRTCYVRFNGTHSFFLMVIAYLLYIVIGFKYLRKLFNNKPENGVKNEKRVIEHIVDLGVLMIREPLLNVIEKGHIATYRNFSFRRREIHNKDKILNRKKQVLRQYRADFMLKKEEFYVVDVFCDKRNKYLFSMIVRKKRNGNATKHS